MGWLASWIAVPGTAPGMSYSAGRIGLGGIRLEERTDHGARQENLSDHAALGGWNHKV